MEAGQGFESDTERDGEVLWESGLSGDDSGLWQD